MTLLKLTKQYKSDVEQRIICITEKRDNLNPMELTLTPYYQEAVDDCNTQIAHWKATLTTIKTTIKESGD